MSLEAAVQQSMPELIGDLHSAPKPERRLFNQDGYSLEWIIPYCGNERLFFVQVLRDSQNLLEAELTQANPRLDAFLADKMSSLQFRSRPDFVRGKLAIEQWVPSMDCWMVNGYFDHDTTWDNVVAALQAGDPRRQTAEEELASKREAAAKVRDQNEQASTDRVLAAIDNMSDRQVKQFVEVEQAIQSGDTVTAHGQDYHTLDLLINDTKKAASLGDKEAQSVVSHGQQDNATCILPSTNPLRHRHRSELTRKKSKE